MLTLRPYQQAAVAALFGYFDKHSGNPLLVLPTASGKSVIQAAFISETLSRWPGERFLLVSHVKELLQQNADKLAALGVGCSLYSAGLGRKDVGAVTVAGIQSIYKHAHKLGDVSVAMVDECHLLSKKANSMYGRLFGDLRKLCPHLKIVGMSATPFRLDSGPLHKGAARLFTDIAYSITIKEMIALGYLAPLVTAYTKTRADVSRVAKRGGEYIAGQLEHALEPITKAALEEAARHLHDRKSWLVFCVGVRHAKAVALALNGMGYSAAVVVGETPKEQRAARIAAFRVGELRALVSVGVLTTGFDAPNADALICLRPTCSPGLWVQMVGRVTRLAPGKADALVLDFTDNTKTHGPIDQITIDTDGNVKAPGLRLIVCPSCFAEIPPKPACPVCGFEIPKEEAAPRRVKHNTEPSRAEIISSGAPIIETVTGWSFRVHRKEGKPDSLRVTYECGLADRYDQWVCFDHGGYAAEKAIKWWQKHGGAGFPTTALAIKQAGGLKMPGAITVKKDGKYWRILS